MDTQQKVGVFLDEKVYDAIKRLALDEKTSMTKWLARAAEEALKVAKTAKKRKAA